MPRLLFRRKKVLHAIYGDTLVSFTGPFATTVLTLPFKVIAAAVIGEAALLLIDARNTAHRLCLKV
jgi:hypothetical protein